MADAQTFEVSRDMLDILYRLAKTAPPPREYRDVVAGQQAIRLAGELLSPAPHIEAVVRG